MRSWIVESDDLEKHDPAPGLRRASSGESKYTYQAILKELYAPI